MTKQALAFEVREAPEPAAAETTHRLGATIRRIRQEKGLSLQGVARRSGVSVGMLSQVERDLTNPSVRVMTAIRRALGADINELFEEPPVRSRDPDFVRRASQRPRLDLGQVSKELLTTGGPHNLQFMILHIQPGADSGHVRYAAEKGGMVLGGELILQVGEEEARLSEGDSFTFDSSLAHSFRNPGPSVARVLWIIGAVPLDRHL